LQQLVEKILGEMRDRGAISFARFMEYALYCPVYGYYEKEEDTLGRRGDYYTSVSVGPLFGELLALQFAEWLSQMEELAGGTPALPGKLQLVEAGAHKGELARDILRWLHGYEPSLVQKIEYCIVEPSDRRQEWQRRMLANFQPQVRWVKSLEECVGNASGPKNSAANRPGVRGIIFSNELLDAMPVHRLGWDAANGNWFEWGVTFSDGRFEWERLVEETSVRFSNIGATLDPFSVICQAWSEDLLRGLPEGFTIEICPAASQWWAHAAAVLGSGKLLALDYGLKDEEWLSPARVQGTLRAYNHHRLSSDVLSRPGAQDLTAHVNFSALLRAGESAGLTTNGLFSQEQFLTRIATPVLTGKRTFAAWTTERIRQFQTLTHPNHLGRSFRVLLQSRQA
jgi:SAM-dependent MidA family methyltransferase